MERWDARPHNVLELESRIYLHSKIHEFIYLTNHSTLTTSQIREQLHLCQQQFGTLFSMSLVRNLHRADEMEREALIWLLTTLNDQDSIPHLQNIAEQKTLPRPVRLAASLALAGMGVTKEMTKSPTSRLYAIS